MAIENSTSSSNQKSTLTMSSHEIAQLTRKQHSHVIRDIDKMLLQLYGKKDYSTLSNDDPSLDHQQIQGVIKEFDKRGYVKFYKLDQNHTLTLISGYEVTLRFRIIQRWQELEQGCKKSFIEDVVDGMKKAEVKLMGFDQMSLESRKAMKALQWEIQGILGLRPKSQMKRRIDMRAPLNLLINGMSSGEFRRRIGLRGLNRDQDNRPMKTVDFLPLANQYALYRTDLLLSEFLRTNSWNVTYEEACEWYLRYGEIAKHEAEKKYQVNLHNIVAESLREILGFVAEQASLDVSPYTEMEQLIEYESSMLQPA